MVSSPLQSSEVPSSGPSKQCLSEFSCLSRELAGSPVVASGSSEDSLAVVLDPLPLELVDSSVMVSDFSEDSLANVSSVPPNPGVREPSSELVSDVAMASDSPEDSLADVSVCAPPEFVVPQPPEDCRSCRSFPVSGSALESSRSRSRSKGSRQASRCPPSGKHKMPVLPSAIPVHRKN